MSNPSGEASHWVVTLAKEERDRQQQIAAIHGGLSEFLGVLVEAVTAHLVKYQIKFPEKNVLIDSDKTKGKVTVINRSLSPETRAIIQAHPERQKLVCHFEGTPSSVKSFDRQLIASNLGVHGEGVSVECTARELSHGALEPILFPPFDCFN